MSQPVEVAALVNTASDQILEFCEGAIGVLEANSFETMCLWERAQNAGRNWKSAGMGYGAVVGQLDGRDVFISITSAVMYDQKFIIIDPTSVVVDWKLIDEWLVLNMPASVMKDGRLNKTNAMNCHNLFSH